MGIIGRVAAAIRNRPEERRDTGGFSSGIGIGLGNFANAGSFAGAAAAENLATVTAGVSVIASTIGSLPAFVYRRDGASRSEAPDHPVARLIRSPNARQSWPDLIEFLTAQMLLHGNALALIETDGNGQAVGLQPVPWPHVMPVLLADQRLAFDVVQFGPWGGTGLPRRMLDTEVLHLRDRSDDSYLGRSRLARAPQVIEAALLLQEFSASFLRNGAALNGVLKHPGKLSDAGKDFLRARFNERFGGTGRAGGTVVLDEAMTYDPIIPNPEASQVLESRQFITEELARLLGVPLPLVNIWTHSSFTNSATASSWMGTFTILPIVRKIEAAFLKSVFADPFGPFFLELDMTGLMRGDATAQQAANVAAVAAGIMTKDEARRDLGLNPLAVGGVPLDGVVSGTEP